MTWRELTVQNFNSLDRKVVVDVRSPCEYLIESIPDAINIPLLSDEERALIGTVYKQDGEMQARRRAVGMIAPRIPAIVDRIMAIKKPRHTLVVHCWRGGLRSEAVVSFLSVVGIDCFRLTGGYKAWRRQVVEDFEKDAYSFETIVLDGLTGTGKTEILTELSKQGIPVCDLESLANHRGSTFGALGLAPQPSQKDFEARLWCLLEKCQADTLILEAESRKIGRLALPNFLYKRIKTGRKILIEAPMASRVSRLLEIYCQGIDKANVIHMVEKSAPIKEKLGGERTRALIDRLKSDDLEGFVEMLLLEYYDPLYAKHLAGAGPFELTVDSRETSKAAEAIAEHLSNSQMDSSQKCISL
ncbi:MAG: tRNA 2-selenouridine(34) synthase MnmH [Cyanobacteria bacterium HKST-UBA02]|nr:tRNA 2-selenouridine(34) synthase MnmH [Cyanobacteria bacterium HKST-UBA02]